MGFKASLRVKCMTEKLDTKPFLEYPNEKLGKPAAIYKHCMEEAKFRLYHLSNQVKNYKQQKNWIQKWFVLEAVALQYRKIIELVAIASIGANQKEYADIRTQIAKDWNARLIFRDIMRINPNFYPRPISGTTPGNTPDDPEAIEEYKEYLDSNTMLDIYDRCGGLLHADNRLGFMRDPDNSFDYLENSVKSFFSLLDCFWVCLVPDYHRYILQLQLESKFAPVIIFGAKMN